MADPARAPLTAEALDAFDDDAHVELVDGELVHETMTSFAHGDAQSGVLVEIRSRFQGGAGGGPGWWIVTEVTVVYEPTQAFRHDVAGWRKDRVPKRPQGKVTVRPDWVCEVLSTNKRKDLVDKRRTLHEHGVPYDWIVDPEGQVLTVLRHSAEGYVVAAVACPGDRARLEPFDAVELDVTKLFGDIEPTPVEE